MLITPHHSAPCTYVWVLQGGLDEQLAAVSPAALPWARHSKFKGKSGEVLLLPGPEVRAHAFALNGAASLTVRVGSSWDARAEGVVP